MRIAWQLGPVLRGLRDHRAAAVLVIAQFGIGLAITVLAVLVGDDFARGGQAAPPANERDLVIVELQLSGRTGDLAERRAAILVEIRRSQHCDGATPVGLPLHALENDLDELDGVQATAYTGGPGIARIAGLALHAGRDLRDGDRGVTIISPALADALGGNPLGRRLHSRAHGDVVIVGIAELDGQVFAKRTAIYPVGDLSPRVVVLVRAVPGRGDLLLADLRARLQQPGQHVEVAAVFDRLAHTARPIGSVLGILATIVGTIVLVVLVGSMGLTYFLLSTRTREIGLRRAMGATRVDVIAQFLLENALLAGAGTIVGLGIVLAMTPLLSGEQGGFKMRWSLVTITTVVVVALDLLATLVPARKAATISPIAASRK